MTVPAAAHDHMITESAKDVGCVEPYAAEEGVGAMPGAPDMARQCRIAGLSGRCHPAGV
jgi:hypothetical protein